MSEEVKAKLKTHTEKAKAYKGPERRKNKPTVRKKDERRADLQIITSVGQADLYLWTMSILIMGIILVFLSVYSYMRG